MSEFKPGEPNPMKYIVESWHNGGGYYWAGWQYFEALGRTGLSLSEIEVANRRAEFDMLFYRFYDAKECEAYLKRPPE